MENSRHVSDMNTLHILMVALSPLVTNTSADPPLNGPNSDLPSVNRHFSLDSDMHKNWRKKHAMRQSSCYLLVYFLLQLSLSDSNKTAYSQ